MHLKDFYLLTKLRQVFYVWRLKKPIKNTGFLRVKRVVSIIYRVFASL